MKYLFFFIYLILNISVFSQSVDTLFKNKGEIEIFTINSISKNGKLIGTVCFYNSLKNLTKKIEYRNGLDDGEIIYFVNSKKFEVIRVYDKFTSIILGS